MIKRFVQKAVRNERGFRHVEADKRELAVVAGVEAVTFIHGRRDMILFSASSGCARRLMWFLFRWWVGSCWLGARPALLRFVLERSLRRADPRARA